MFPFSQTNSLHESCKDVADTLRTLELIARLQAENPNFDLAVTIIGGPLDLSIEGPRMLKIEGDQGCIRFYQHRQTDLLTKLHTLDKLVKTSFEEAATKLPDEDQLGLHKSRQVLQILDNSGSAGDWLTTRLPFPRSIFLIDDLDGDTP